MTEPTTQDILDGEAARRPRAAAGALGAGILTLLGGILSTVVYGDFPSARLLESLQRTAAGGQGESLKALQVDFFADNTAALAGVAILLALAAAGVGVALVFLYRATAARRAETPRAAVIATIVGAVCLALFPLVQTGGIVLSSRAFADAEDRSVEAAREALTGPAQVPAFVLQFVGQFGLAVALVLLAINAMRAGLLTRFMGILGCIVGALFILPIGSQLPVVQSFWLIALGALFLGRWPGGMPPAWERGVAVPWPTQQELREERDREGGAPEPRAAQAAPATPRRTKKRKRR